jgi:urocanate hydratase
MASDLAEVLRTIEAALAAIRALSPALSGNSVSILDVIVTVDEADLVVEAVGADGESIVPVARVARDAPGDAAKIALNYAIGRLVSRATELERPER